MTDTRISRVLRGADGRLRPIIRALIYAALAFWLLSADEFLGPPRGRDRGRLTLHPQPARRTPPLSP